MKEHFVLSRQPGKRGRRTINHEGKEYRAIKVCSMHPHKMEKDVIVYDVEWSCCGKKDVKTQKQLNVLAGNMPGQCIDCRLGRKPVADSGGAMFTPSQRAKAEVVWVDSPWGLVQSLFGWGNEARISRPWSLE